MPLLKDKYLESAGEESADLEEKAQAEKKVEAIQESPQEILKPEEKLVKPKTELPKEEKIETEPTKGVGLAEKTESYLELVDEKAEVEKAIKEKGTKELAEKQESAQAREQVKQLQGLDSKIQVKALSDLAFQKGLDFAIETAKGLNDAYVLDEFHKALTGDLQRKLMEKVELKKL